MRLYHGSTLIIKHPDLKHSRKNIDFGVGFYTTPIYEQAVSWCNRFVDNSQPGIVSAYEFDKLALKELEVLHFRSYSEEWLDFVLACRRGKDKSDYDIVIGGIANDRVFNTVELYFSKLIDKREALKRLRYEKPNLQVCFRSELSLSYLRFKGSEEL